MAAVTDNNRLLGEMSSDIKYLIQQNNDQHVRLTAVERFQWKMVGIATAIPTVVSSIGLALKFTIA
jgi:hypothetical protein